MKFFAILAVFSIIVTLSDTQAPMFDVDQERIQREKFYSLFEAKLTEEELQNPEKKRKKTRTVTTLEEYKKLIESIEVALSKKKGRTQRDYYLINKYEILTVGDTKKVILKRKLPDEPIRFIVPYEQIFETIHRIHIQVGHKCRDIMIEACSKNHLNITVEMITAFLSSCNQCIMNKKRNKTTGMVVKPIYSENFNQRAQMDLIDFQSLPDGEFKWVMVYQDHFTKFIVLRPLRNKSAFDVASALIDIFTIFGVPVLLQSDNGREFRNQVITALKQMWPDLSFVHGRARHPQSQGSVERANADIKKMIATWMRENKSTKWTIGLKFVQLRKNQARQAEAMKTRSKRYLPEVSIGDYVALPIPDVDRGLSEAPNLICRIIDIDYSKSLYELACQAGVLDTLYSRNSFDLVKDCTIELNIKVDKKLGLRQAVREISIGGGQGMTKCNCTGACLTNKCTCKKAGLLCNSRCHGSNSTCKNK